MRLVFHSPQFLPSIGGLQNVVHYWASALAERGHAITVTTCTPGEADAAVTYDVIRNPGFRELIQTMKSADLVIMFNLSLKQFPHWVLSGKPLWLSHHTALYYDGGRRPILKRFKQWMANNFACGQSACSHYVSRLYKNCQVVHSPYDEKVFRRKEMQRIPGSILFAGRLVTDKGADLLIEAISLLNYNEASTRFAATIVGNGPEERNLRELASQKGTADWIRFETAVDSESLARMLQVHEIMVVPSRMEPFGIVVLEGLACGCKLVVSNQGGLPEAGGNHADYFEPASAKDLARAIQVAARRLAPEYSEIKEYLSAFTIKSTAEMMETLLNKAVSSC